MRSILILTAACLSFSATAQPIWQQKPEPAENNQPLAYPRFYAGSNTDLALLSSSVFSKPEQSTGFTVPRFTALVHIGLLLHYDFNHRTGIYSGLNIRNIGFIEQGDDDQRIKHRVYTIGLPLAIKIGNLRNRNFFLAGGGVDVPFHYRMKVADDGKKYKGVISGWFGKHDVVSSLLPYVFAGHSFDPGIVFKIYYYPGNFLNTDYYVINPLNAEHIYPYRDYKVNLILLSLGIDIHYGQYRIQQREYERSHPGN